MLLEKIKSPKELKELTSGQLQELVVEARTALLEKISHHGGHNGPNLGMVEMPFLMLRSMMRFLVTRIRKKASTISLQSVIPPPQFRWQMVWRKPVT